MLEATKGQEPQAKEMLTYDVKVNLDIEFKRRAVDFIKSNAASETPLFLYFNPHWIASLVVPGSNFGRCCAGGPYRALTDPFTGCGGGAPRVTGRIR